MANKKGTGLLMVWVDVPADKEKEFNRWYNDEHLAERLAIPGFLAGARYEAVKGSPKHLAYYELESPAALESAAYKKVIANPTEWTKRFGPQAIGTTYIRNVYTMIHPKSLTPAITGSRWRRRSRSGAWTCRARSMTSGTRGTARSTCRTTRRCPASSAAGAIAR